MGKVDKNVWALEVWVYFIRGAKNDRKGKADFQPRTSFKNRGCRELTPQAQTAIPLVAYGKVDPLQMVKIIIVQRTGPNT